MFLGSSQNEFSVGRWFLQCFQKSIEGLRRQHMNLINDVHLIATGLRRYAYLFNKAADVFHRVVGGGIELMNIEGVTVLERKAAVARAAGFCFRRQVLAIDGFGKNTGAGGFTNTAGTTEQKCLSKLIVLDRIF